VRYLPYYARAPTYIIEYKISLFVFLQNIHVLIQLSDTNRLYNFKRCEIVKNIISNFKQEFNNKSLIIRVYKQENNTELLILSDSAIIYLRIINEEKVFS